MFSTFLVVAPERAKFKAAPYRLRPERENPMTVTSSSTQAPPSVGTLAPDFTLPSTSGERVTLSRLRGKPVLIAFFPLAFSPTCTAELCEMRDDWDDFASRNLVVLPISVD